MPDNDAAARLKEHIAMCEARIVELEGMIIDKGTKEQMLARQKNKLAGLKAQPPKG